MKKALKKLDNKGFTLVELIIVIAIIAVLAAVLAPQYLKYVERSRVSADTQTLGEIQNAAKVAIADPANDITLADLAKYTDVFYIGGTKVGALFGEAVVITNRALKKDFRYMIKQNGGMLAKGRLLGIQFDTLFTDDLYFKISAHADELAMKLKKIFLEKGYGLRYDSYTNQQFPILPDSHIEKLKEKYVFEFWEKVSDAESAVRFCTSWATKPEVVEELIRDIEAC